MENDIHMIFLPERILLMKKNLMTIIGVVLIAASVFGLIAAGFGMNDVSDILRYNKLKKSEVKDAISFLEKNIAELEEQELAVAENKENNSSGDNSATLVENVTTPVQQNPIEVDWDAVDDYDTAVSARTEIQQQIEYVNGQVVGATSRLSEAEEQLSACTSNLGEIETSYETVYPLYEYYLDLQSTYEKALNDGSGIKAAGLAAAVKVAKAAYEAELGGRSMATIVADYQNAKAAYDSALAERNAASANLKDLQATLDEANLALADVEWRIKNAETNRQKADEHNRWNVLHADDGSSTQSAVNTVNSGDMAEMLSGLQELGDARTIVRTGVDALLGIDGIAARVTSSSDYDSVVNAARQYVDESSLIMERELDMRQRMCSFMRLLGIGCLLAGIACMIADHRKRVTSLRIIFIVCGIALVASAGVTTYALIEGFNECVYSLEDGTANGSLQMSATYIMLGVSLLSAVSSGICFMSCPTEAAEIAAAEEKLGIKKTEPLEEDEEDGYINLVDKSLQTTRRFDALKVWFSFRTRGADGWSQIITTCIENAAYLYERLEASPDFHAVVKPEISSIVFRVLPLQNSAEDADALQKRIRRTLMHSHGIVIGQTVCSNETCLKFTLLNPRLTHKELDHLLNLILSLRTVK